ncbi:protein FAM43A-like [Dreissena polymorpha]|uniref:PID domain-containing protein n=1 Tax=Dreissena polymorpha TaxID=45954 RepID=A0A9D4FYC9_DREPO|nr:protein FAM43A-like [Dreissena polymorpha]XP_052217913.1 protein FAM43A-like [Dreissena polymorpha]KAH3805641.1 hypothetical protein DPMN_133946 [Dreissena polymorpha]KAH3805799.1 hypothetical protein DPMN_134107 [Dreissena polymorpha]
MFNRLKDRAKISDQDPSFTVRYIGSAETFTATGKGCTTPLVQRLWDNAEEEQFLPRMRVKITPSGVSMKSLDKKKVPEKMFPIENISFCNVDLEVNDRIFSWISRPADDKMWECHAVYCSSTEKARSMSLVLTRAFHIAYKEWKSSQTKEVREMEKHHRSKSLPAISLEKKMRTTRDPVTKQQSLDLRNSQVQTETSVMENIHVLANGLSLAETAFKSQTSVKSNLSSKAAISDATSDYTDMDSDIKPGTSSEVELTGEASGDQIEDCDLRL